MGTLGSGTRDPPQSLKVGPGAPIDPHNNISSLLDLFCSRHIYIYILYIYIYVYIRIYINIYYIYNMEIIFHE